MISKHERHDLFGKTFLEVLVLKPPFIFDMPAMDNACFHYLLENDARYNFQGKEINVAGQESVLLNCRTVGNNVSSNNISKENKLVIVHFHPDILKNVYQRELPSLLKKPKNAVSNKIIERINNDFLIQKYIEGLLFYFENPTLVNEDKLVLKLKEIIILLSQTKNADAIQMILSQLFSQQYILSDRLSMPTYIPI
ncbi:hypothetical protein [Pedobacter aquatilis]|uniref:hypothetical protein n=1 Tax=Pedobacter aquatilis TaxID=351343 RepID=UPI002931D8F7|nr:hypothetical protein [Pedobacter aquatilis]